MLSCICTTAYKNHNKVHAKTEVLKYSDKTFVKTTAIPEVGRRDSVHLSSVYTDYSFSSFVCGYTYKVKLFFRVGRISLQSEGILYFIHITTALWLY